MEDVNNGDEGEDKVLQLMIENRVLECEKSKAEADVELWKAKYSQLQQRIRELENLLSLNCRHPHVSDTPLPNSPFWHSGHVDGGKAIAPFEPQQDDRSKARKRLAFAEEGSPNKNMAPDTPAGKRPSVIDVIDIDDSDGDAKKNTQTQRPAPIVEGSNLDPRSTVFGSDGNSDENELIQNGSDNKDSNFGHVGNMSSFPTMRRKRSCYVVDSDAESDDDDDDIPISRLMSRRNKLQKTDLLSDRYARTRDYSRDEVSGSTNERCLKRLRKCGGKGLTGERLSDNVRVTTTKYGSGIPTDETVENEDEEEYSNSEGYSTDSFIVDSSEVSESDSASDGDSASESDAVTDNTDPSSNSEDAANDIMGYKDAISRIRRDRGQRAKWEFEGDMLAAFGKDPELCLQAVCALYRQQTSEEKVVKGTLVHNGRGFSQCDAWRGSKLAEFLIDGDPAGDLKKSVEELQERDPKGLEVCKQLASRYSKQLFEIYQSKEDPLFFPS